MTGVDPSGIGSTRPAGPAPATMRYIAALPFSAAAPGTGLMYVIDRSSAATIGNIPLFCGTAEPEIWTWRPTSSAPKSTSGLLRLNVGPFTAAMSPPAPVVEMQRYPSLGTKLQGGNSGPPSIVICTVPSSTPGYANCSGVLSNTLQANGLPGFCS